MEKVNDYVSGLRPSRREEMLEELQSMLSKVRINLIASRQIASEKWRSQHALMKHAQTRKLMNVLRRTEGLL